MDLELTIWGGLEDSIASAVGGWRDVCQWPLGDARIAAFLVLERPLTTLKLPFASIGLDCLLIIQSGQSSSWMTDPIYSAY